MVPVFGDEGSACVSVIDTQLESCMPCSSIAEMWLTEIQRHFSTLKHERNTVLLTTSQSLIYHLPDGLAYYILWSVVLFVCRSDSGMPFWAFRTTISSCMPYDIENRLRGRHYDGNKKCQKDSLWRIIENSLSAVRVIRIHFSSLFSRLPTKLQMRHLQY